jgi:hypothetical protein
MNKLAENLGTFTPPSAAYSTGSTTGVNSLTNLEKMISNFIGLGTVLGGLMFIGYFILGGIKWLTAAGDSGKVQKARDQMVQAGMGLVVIIASYSVIGLIGTVLGLNLLRPAETIFSLIPR